MKTTPDGRKRSRAVRKSDAAIKGTPEVGKPLEVMLEAMREHWVQGQWDQAAAIAKITDEELEFLHRIYRRAERVSDPD